MDKINVNMHMEVYGDIKKAMIYFVISTKLPLLVRTVSQNYRYSRAHHIFQKGIRWLPDVFNV
ncbi:hypothetical protein NBY09_13110 [Elizabethkingia anophelis]|uniref:hypothetical protein n=1 Tax=Elizabethkingia anophelis TaxID=1117645 RepID=UPI00234FE132|nr:hypothetical protein [Elizabethkingia anophelis]MDC8027095.1 hypothetical protein [Elizabethkingia anophelis]